MADRLGHADANFTLRVYTHVYDDQRAAAALPLQELLAGTMARPVATQPASSTGAQRGVDALRALHTALGDFLSNAPEWAKGFALSAMTGQTTAPAAEDHRQTLHHAER